MWHIKSRLACAAVDDYADGDGICAVCAALLKRFEDNGLDVDTVVQTGVTLLIIALMTHVLACLYVSSPLHTRGF